MPRRTEENGEQLSQECSGPVSNRAPPEQTWTDSALHQPTFAQRQWRKAIFQPVFLLLNSASWEQSPIGQMNCAIPLSLR
jgi:hypothetical protein